jgi:hypothetical protein
MKNIINLNYKEKNEKKLRLDLEFIEFIEFV